MKEKWVAFTEKHAEIWKFIKFTFTGASTSVLELAVFAFLQYVVFKSMNTTPVTDNAVLHFLGIQYKGYMYSYAISAVIGYAAAYVMNRKLTFQADANPVLSTILYTIMVVCTIAFNTWFGAYLGTIVTNHHPAHQVAGDDRTHPVDLSAEPLCHPPQKESQGGAAAGKCRYPRRCGCLTPKEGSALFRYTPARCIFCFDLTSPSITGFCFVLYRAPSSEQALSPRRLLFLSIWHILVKNR